jgi:hypothetical protein
MAATRAHLDDPFLTPIDTFDEVWRAPRPEDRLEGARRAARAFHERMQSAPKVRFFRSMKLARVPYPTKYALLNATSIPTPFLHIVNRLFVVQVDFRGETKTLLLSPTDIHRAAETPFFRALSESLGPLRELGERIIAERCGTVQERLHELGISPESIDYISFDHLHTQDVRTWIGGNGVAAFFPKAKLLVMREEWESAHGLLPTQAQWYCPDGVRGVDPERVVLLDGSVMLGESVAIVRSPGHTEGNHSFVTRTDRGVIVTSENGVGADAYAPEASRIPGLRKYARATGAEVVLNGNTLESSVNQYVSMVMEKTIAGPAPDNPDFPNVVCSSEFDSHWAFPGLKPTYHVGDLSFGELAKPRRESLAEARA